MSADHGDPFTADPEVPGQECAQRVVGFAFFRSRGDADFQRSIGHFTREACARAAWNDFDANCHLMRFGKLGDRTV